MKRAFWGLCLLLLTIWQSWALADSVTLDRHRWHLVSLTETTNLATFFEDHSGVNSLWTWEADTWQARFKSPLPHSPYPTLETIENKKGYWVRIQNHTVLPTYSGSISHIGDYSLSVSGWHLLGTGESLDVIAFFEDTIVGTVWVWSDNTWSIYTQGDTGSDNQFNATHQTNFATLRTIPAGSGFWVHIGNGQLPPTFGTALFGQDIFP